MYVLAVAATLPALLKVLGNSKRKRRAKRASFAYSVPLVTLPLLFRKGIKMLFDGAFAAYRNPPSHQNVLMPKDADFERIVLANQLMKVLDGAGNQTHYNSEDAYGTNQQS